METQTRSHSTHLKFAAILGSLLLPVLSQAHFLPGESNSFQSGLSHPFHGLDHVLAMLAVGLWAAQLGGRALWLVPATFVSLMICGGALGMAGLHIAGVETGIILSVLTLGVLVASAIRMPLAASMGVVGLFAIFHGHAHGSEMPATASGFGYAAGFVLATVLLHGCGMATALFASRKITVPTIRFAGAAIALAGLCLWLG